MTLEWARVLLTCPCGTGVYVVVVVLATPCYGHSLEERSGSMYSIFQARCVYIAIRHPDRTTIHELADTSDAIQVTCDL